VYNNLEKKIAGWHTRRDVLAVQMKNMLEGAAFNHQTINQGPALKLIVQGQELLFEVNLCARFLPFCESN
jgi:hypothetical protein